MIHETLSEAHRDGRDRMAEFGATPINCLQSGDGAVALVHADFEPYEGEYERAGYLRLHLCTAHVGRIYRAGEDGSRMEGVLRPGSFGVTLPDAASSGYWPRTQALAIMLSADRLAEMDGVGVDDLAPAANELHRDPLVTSVMSALWRDAEAHGLASAFFDHGLAVILRRLADYSAERPAGEPRAAGPLSKPSLRRAQEMIEAGLGSELKVSDLAAECGRDVRSFTRSFRASTGFAPYEYLTLRRMENAKRLLLTDASITEIAIAIGFSNPSKFSAAFRRNIGCSPSIWRRQNRPYAEASSGGR